MQTTFAVGYVSIAADLVMLMRCLLMSATSGGPASQHPLVPLGASDRADSAVHDAVEDEKRGRARERFWFRRIGGFLMIAFWIPFITGTIYGVWYVKAEKDAEKAKLAQQLRYASLLL